MTRTTNDLPVQYGDDAEDLRQEGITDPAVYFQVPQQGRPETGWRPSTHVPGDDCEACKTQRRFIADCLARGVQPGMEQQHTSIDLACDLCGKIATVAGQDAVRLMHSVSATHRQNHFDGTAGLERAEVSVLPVAVTA